MNKKLIMGGMLGLVALGAGALALTTLGGSESGDRPAARTARAAYAGSYNEPLIFAEDGSLLPSGPDVDGPVKVVKQADNGSTAPGKNDPAPPASGGPATTEPADEDDDDTTGGPVDSDDDTPSTPNVPGDQPGGDQQGGNGNGNNGTGSGYIFSEKLNDAICELLGCNPPQLPNIPGLADAVCSAGDCDDDHETIEPKIDPCAILGNCPTPDPIDFDLDIRGRVRMR